MKAYRMLEWEKPPQLLDVPIPEPDAGQVRLRVGASGACHSDLHLMDWPEGTVGFKLPFTLGHEVAGWVDKLGPGAHGFEVGDKVAVHGPWGCGRCARCRRGEENYCARAAERAAAGVGLGVDGGMAEYLLVPSTRHLVPIGRLDPTEAAPLTDAGLTSYHAVARSRSRLGPGQTAVVIGAGGLGHMAIQILRALTPAFVVALDRDDLQLALAREVGAHLAVNVKDAGDDPATTILEGHRAAVVLDFVGSKDTLALAAKLVDTLGHLTIVGLGGGTLEVGFFALPYEVSVATTYWGSVPELMEVMALAESGRIQSHVERFSLEQVDEAYRRLREGTLRGRAVIVP